MTTLVEEHSATILTQYSCLLGSVHEKMIRISWTYLKSKNGCEWVLLGSSKAFYHSFTYRLGFSTLTGYNYADEYEKNFKIFIFSSITLFTTPPISIFFSNFKHDDWELKFWKNIHRRAVKYTSKEYDFKIISNQYPY